jgi:wyosine [tRNA(Phe)-imidazoG37] synthetase (radical SAM superfamily)
MAYDIGVVTNARPIRSSIYGPVDSWRLGRSLGVDLLLVDSICSFECVYCQLGKINRVTRAREIFVPTPQVLRDLDKFDWQTADVITISGNGEPTLAANLGDVIAAIRGTTGKPVAVLTNSTLLYRDDVRSEISLADRIYCKLDAWSEEHLMRVDRPAKGITLNSIVKGIDRLRRSYRGFLAIQTMLLAEPNNAELNDLASIVRDIQPDEVEINLPLRPIPLKWNFDSRGNINSPPEGWRQLRSVTPERASAIGSRLSAATGVRVITPFDPDINARRRY